MSRKQRAVHASAIAAIVVLAACSSDTIVDRNIASGIVTGTVTSQIGAVYGVGIHVIAYASCGDTVVVGAGGGGPTDEYGHYSVNVIGGVARQACVVTSAVRKTNTRSDSVAAAPVQLMLRDWTANRTDTARVDIALP
jgi:hypothetical protein